MRIVISGTHASGKSTVVSDFADRHPEYAVLPDPFELVDEFWDATSAASFVAQLGVSAARLHPDETEGSLIAERGPLDFLAYLRALDDLDGSTGSRELMERLTEVTREAMQHVDLLVVLPLTPCDEIFVSDDENLPLRETMNDALLDLIADEDVIGHDLNTVEIVGTRAQRLTALERTVDVFRSA
ncbi:AAA family ATPase [Microbacterium sp. R86528]|uniref:AAA family ATPase n=1 Tax=Microbacterium sp. R86528 TaxID=3093864 RepID=UPI0037CC399D